MRKGKRFIENENLIIYVGTAIFFILAISVGIVMYMTTKTNSKIENNGQQISEENQNENEIAENVSSNMGKTVEEQQKNEETPKTENTANTNSNSKKEDSATQSVTPKTETTTPSTTQDTKKEEKTENEKQEKEEQPVVEEKEEVSETKNPITFIKPTDGEIISEFAQDNLIYSETLKEWVTHTGVDIKADKTSIIKAAADGVISSIINDPRYGLTVVITHDNGYETVYSNLLTAEFVVEGEEVKQGQTIGTAGNTAAFESSMECHLHFEILQDGKYLDPSIYLKQ